MNSKLGVFVARGDTVLEATVTVVRTVEEIAPTQDNPNRHPAVGVEIVKWLEIVTFGRNLT
jgi:hypothetical protein